MKYFEYKSSLYDIKFTGTLYHKISVIQDKSGIGKSYLFNIMASDPSHEEFIIINSFDLIYTFTDERYTDKIFFIDEDILEVLIRDNKGKGAIRGCVGYILLISRNENIPLPIHYKAIYTFHSENNTYYITQKYTKDHRDFSVLQSVDGVLTEDTNTGFEYYSHWFKNVVSTYGNQLLLPMYMLTNYGLIADAADIGSYYDALKRLGCKMVLFESFEELLCERANFPKLSDDTILSYISSEEAYYYYLIKQCTQLDKNIYYSKSKYLCDYFYNLAPYIGAKEVQNREFKTFNIIQRNNNLGKYTEYLEYYNQLFSTHIEYRTAIDHSANSIIFSWFKDNILNISCSYKGDVTHKYIAITDEGKALAVVYFHLISEMDLNRLLQTELSDDICKGIVLNYFRNTGAESASNEAYFLSSQFKETMKMEHDLNYNDTFVKAYCVLRSKGLL